MRVLFQDGGSPRSGEKLRTSIEILRVNLWTPLKKHPSNLDLFVPPSGETKCRGAGAAPPCDRNHRRPPAQAQLPSEGLAPSLTTAGRSRGSGRAHLQGVLSKACFKSCPPFPPFFGTSIYSPWTPGKLQNSKFSTHALVAGNRLRRFSDRLPLPDSMHLNYQQVIAPPRGIGRTWGDGRRGRGGAGWNHKSPVQKQEVTFPKNCDTRLQRGTRCR